MQLHTLPGWKISEKIRAQEITPAEVFQYFRERALRWNKKVNAFVRIFEEPLPYEASFDSPLFGVPIVIKDNICIQHQEVTCASKILKGFISPYDATVIERLKRAGLQILGIANMDEFAFGSSCETSCYGPTRNPWDLNHVPGGSSGGSAVSVAAGLAPISLGSDTGGSIRQPAAFCGVVGMKPTYGRVSRYGLIAFGSSFDQIGPFCRDIKDNAYLLKIIAGHDSKDSTSASVPCADYPTALNQSIKGYKIGVPSEYFVQGLDEAVRIKVNAALELFRENGAVIETMHLPHTEYAVATYYVLASSEASSNLSRFDGIKYGLRAKASSLLELYKRTRSSGFGKEAKRRILLGTFSLSSGYYDAYYLKALKVRTLMQRDFTEAFKKFDALIVPTAPSVAFKLNEKLEDPLSMYLSDIYTISANLAGIPAISLPCGFTDQGLPVGFQILGGSFQEARIMQLASFYQSSTDWHTKFPEEHE